jgi:hypothetical protein
LVLLETLFQHLPLDITVGALYDIVCSLERSCRLWGFLDRYLDRLSFAVSVFHVFGHEWACQLLYHPRKRVGFGFTNGEGCERFWHSISHLIAHLRICGVSRQCFSTPFWTQVIVVPQSAVYSGYSNRERGGGKPLASGRMDSQTPCA